MVQQQAQAQRFTGANPLGRKCHQLGPKLRVLHYRAVLPRRLGVDDAHAAHQQKQQENLARAGPYG
jgi:hypothetical protein